MSAIFVHVSDIHFGQERGGVVVVHDDVKLRVIEDAARFVKSLPGERAHGVLVTGDIAYAGKPAEYQAAGEWLDKLAAAIGCEKTDVEVVPGNHDIDQSEISMSAEFLLSKVDEEGEPALDSIIASDNDREVFYHRFKAYQPFAEGYDCPLDKSGSLVQSRLLQLAPGRAVRFWGLNSAVICSKRRDEEGKLLLGARQRVLPRREGEELVVLAHHPLHWLKDSEDAKRYIRNRARVFISGHEHKPRVLVDTVRPGCDLMMMASGAMVPPTANGEYNYSYNVIEFAWDIDSDALAVTVHPRAWYDDDKDFRDAPEQLDGNGPTFVLGCQRYATADSAGPAKADKSSPVVDASSQAEVDIAICAEESMPDEFPLLLLKYFRDLKPGQRLVVLARLGAVPDDWDEPLTHAIERSKIDELARKGRLSELQQAIDAVVAEKNENKGPEE